MTDKNCKTVFFAKKLLYKLTRLIVGGVRIYKMAEENKDNEKVERVEPVFFLNNEVKQENDKWLTTLEVCMAVCEVLENDITLKEHSA